MADTPAQRQARYRARHPERVKAARVVCKARDTAWRAANRATINTCGRAWYAKNRAKILALRKAAYDPIKNRAKSAADYVKRKTAVLAKNKAWRVANPEKCRKLKNDWIERNKEYYRARSAEYGADRYDLMRKATPKWANRFYMREIYHLAQLRTKFLGVLHHVDHIIPLQSDLVCGLHVENNLRVIPASVNIQKSNRLMEGM